jgi:hypothetical protein
MDEHETIAAGAEVVSRSPDNPLPNGSAGQSWRALPL